MEGSGCPVMGATQGPGAKTEDISLPKARFTSFSCYSGQKWGGGSGLPGRKLQQMANGRGAGVRESMPPPPPPHFTLWTEDAPSASWSRTLRAVLGVPWETAVPGASLQGAKTDKSRLGHRVLTCREGHLLGRQNGITRAWVGAHSPR